ncbi:hypothetical protein C8A03DRAFT_42983 [Achaetomium macrosporum]|uniref:Apple domain-containing protein n=1 Tax=Achaetomium macrosporum TaxID=79813 RepID=A0AAN7HD96_9PEZI|nr:hypothetical protein C8A03DRAFT_42983 [Achaetomium macrosporum]
MRPRPVVVALVALATGLLPTGVLGIAINHGVCSVESVLEYFTCLRPIPEDCFDSLAEQATAWCASYLSVAPVTVYRTTVVPVSTETVTETATATTTSTEIDITTVEVLQTTTVTDVAEATVTETVTVSGQTVAIVTKRHIRTPVGPPAVSVTASAAPSCVDLGERKLKNLQRRHPASRLSRACSCLNPHPTAITLDAITVAASTVTVTETGTVTVVVPETLLSSELVTKVATQDVTVTETLTATATATVSPPAPVDPCDLRFSTTTDLSLLAGRLQNMPGVATSKECCQLCHNTISCAFAISPADGQCSLMVLPPSGPRRRREEEQCPGGMMALHGPALDADGVVFKGPCWIPGY